MAADPMPIVVTTVPTVVVPAPGRELAIDVMAGTGFRIGNGDGLFVDAFVGGTVEVTSASGWGVRLEGGNFLNLFPDLGGGAEGQVTLFRALGPVEFGVWAWGEFEYPIVGYGRGAGISANVEYEGPRLYVSSENRLWLWPGVRLFSETDAEFDVTDRVTLATYLRFRGLGDWWGGAGIDVHATDRIELWTNLEYGWAGLNDLEAGVEVKVTERISVWTEAGFEFDPGLEFDWLDFGVGFELTDTLTVKGVLAIDDNPFAFDYAEVWAELDRPIGTGPLSLIGELGVGYEDSPYVWGNIGIRYKLGGPADREDNRLFDNVAL
ncbi:MAG: hypothetical protein IT534_07025 [Bauldia sp.]|nr:hypothetical protein [Bauldia sp.]